MESSPNPQQPKTDEIDLIEVIRHIWNGRWLIAKVTLAFMVLGLVIAFTTTEQFKAEARLLPEVKNESGASSLLKQFGGLGGLNINLGEGQDAIRPELYPHLLRSTSFYLHIMQSKIEKDGKRIFVHSYVNDYGSFSFSQFIKKYTIDLPGRIMQKIRGDSSGLISENQGDDELIKINAYEYETIEKLSTKISSYYNKSNGIITVASEFEDPLVAAQIAELSVNYLKEYISAYRVEKAQQDLEFIFQRYLEKEIEFKKAHANLATFLDANRNIISATSRIEQQRLENEYNLAFNVFNGLAQQLEQSRLKVQEVTPVIKMLEPVHVPFQRSKPKRMFILVINIFLGVLMGMMVIYLKYMWHRKFKSFFTRL